MADSPGRLLSSICLGGGGYGGSSGSGSGSSSAQSAKYGCVNIFLHLFDWNRRLSKKGLFFSKKLLPSTLDGAGQSKRRRRRRRGNGKAMVVAAYEERLPMAKLLLIADENQRNGGNNGSNSTARDEDDLEEEEEEEDDDDDDHEEQQEAKERGDEEQQKLDNAGACNNEDSRRNSTSSDRFFPCSSEIRSLQELLHTDHDECPRMLQEFLKPSEQKPLFSLLLEEAKSAPPDPQAPAKSSKARKPRPRKRSSNSLSRQVSSERVALCRSTNSRKSSSSSPLAGSSSSRKCPGVASVATVGVASAGCGGFSRRTSGLFLEAAAKILDPRGHSSKPLTRVLPGSSRKNISDSRKVAALEEPERYSPEQQEKMQRRSFEVLPSDTKALALPTTRSVSAPCSPGRSVDYGSCASIRSLMELFLDDLEEDLEMSHLSTSFLSPPRYQQVSETGSPSLSRNRSIHLPDKAEEVPKTVPIDDLKDDDYISFREFLTASSSLTKARKADSPPTSEADEEVSTSADMTATLGASGHDQDQLQNSCNPRDNCGFMVHNPLFDDSNSLYNYSEMDELNEDDHGLEDILKSILNQTSDQAKEERDSSRLTWLPDASSNLAAPENFTIYNNTNNISNNKDGNSSCSDESHQLDSDSVEVTSESNCGEDSGQPSPVSVLDSPFDDELPGKRGRRGPSSSKTSRKRLEFSDDHQTANVPTSSSSCSSSSSSSSLTSVARFQNFDTNALEEAEEYIAMILEESGICYHANVMTLLIAEAKSDCSDGEFNAGIINTSVFERVEDRMRVQQLIEHLESCSTSSRAEERPSHHSLGSLRAHYGGYNQSRSRRRMVFDFMNEILGSIVGKYMESNHSRAISGNQLVLETRRRTLEWKRQAFESVHQLVDMEMSRVINFNCSGEVSDIGLSCEHYIFKSMMEELARDLLSLQSSQAV